MEYIDGQTPLSEEEKEGLIITSISTKKELDEYEQKNIEDAVQWVMFTRFKSEEVLSEKFIQGLHKRMFSNVWRWAGKFRNSNKNLGVEWWKVPLELKQLLDDTKFWINNNTFSEDVLNI